MYEEILVDFTKSGSRYLVTGGIAVIMHGYFRTTKDLDILPDLNPENLERMISVLEQYGYTPRVPVPARDLKYPEKRKQLYEEKNMKVFTFIDLKNPPNPIDFMIYSSLNFEEAFERKKVYQIRGIDIYTVSIDDLIELKKKVQRPIDKIDLGILEKLKKKDSLKLPEGIWDFESDFDIKTTDIILRYRLVPPEQMLQELTKMRNFADLFTKVG